MKGGIEKLKALHPEMVQWRRYLHRHPELSYQEQRTAAWVADKLEEFGIRVRRNAGGHGVIGDLDSGSPGPRVALRADMDALPIQDEKGCEYSSSIPGVMHACGHDGHMAALLGAAKWLSANREVLKGSVRFIFQPAEEISPGGALPMIEAGALEGVDTIYGVHLWTPFPAGTVYTRGGALMAAADEFVLEIIGKGGHGGLPHETVDSIMVGSHLVVNLQSIVSRNVNPVEPGVISVGMFHAGTGFNVIADRTSISGTVRTFDPELRIQLQDRIGKVLADTCSMFGAEYDLDYKLGYPPVRNHDGEADRVLRVGRELFGADRVAESPLIMAGEDFAYYLEKVSGAFIFVGAGNPDQGITAPHHHPKFDLDESALLTSAQLLASLAVDRLNGSN
ncbi:M20 metallopeptidase family protein [Gorillibacterium sp. sgz5001074]|uniref:M20 metallopeptidase family protein n=1 Tax=Gorillibacterium sp. sgz5001074 TaxID=3446695 RepID=UPI003F66EFA4